VTTFYVFIGSLTFAHKYVYKQIRVTTQRAVGKSKRSSEVIWRFADWGMTDLC